VKAKIIFLIIILSVLKIYPQNIDLQKEYSMDEFENGIRAFHEAEYEQAITYFIKALGFNDNNHLARLFLGESYRKAGYDKNAIFTWNNLLALGYEDRTLKNKIAYLYNRRGVLSEINIDKTYLIREDIKGYYDETTPPNFLKPSQIFVDNRNHYYIASFLTGMVLELDPNFHIVKNHFPLYPKIEKPFGIVVDKEGYLYVSDFENNVVLKFDRLGVIKSKIGFKGINEGGLLGPEYLMLDDDENLYVVDSGNHRINKYKNDGEILFSFGASENGEGKLIKPAGLFYYDKKVYVCDKAANRVVIYDKSGNYIGQFGEDKLEKPYSITRDNFGRFLILCETRLWAYEEENDLWYIIDAPGNRLKKGISIALDKENNILITDFNTSRLLVFSYERKRYTNLNVNIERIFSQKFPEVHLILTVEKDDFTVPTGINETNINVFENGKMVGIIGTAYTKQKNINTDIVVLYDKNSQMVKHNYELRTMMDNWLKNIKDETNVAFASINEEDTVLENDFGATRLSILDSIDSKEGYYYTDKGNALKFGIYHMLNRFSKKAVVLITNSNETGNDFKRFNLENCISLALNNNIPLYIVSFEDGPLSEIYRYMANKTGGDYYRVYRSSDLHELFKKIEDRKDKEIVLSYRSNAQSRFGEEPIVVTVEVNYGGMAGGSKSIYFPANRSAFYK